MKQAQKTYRISNATIRVFLLVVLVAAAFALRIWQVVLPDTTLNRDEAALAYNGYLLQTAGVDEWGKPWPVALLSFGDYKLIGYPSLLSVLFDLLPLSDLVVRLPSVLAGTALVAAVYLLSNHLGLRKWWAVVAASVICFTPVLMFYSRFAYEANVALLYTVCYTWSLWSIHKLTNGRQFVIRVGIALLMTVCALLTYNTPLLLFPLILCWWMLVKFDVSLKRKTGVFLALLVVIVIIGLQLTQLVTHKSGITIFSDEDTWHMMNSYRQEFESEWMQRLFGNKYIFYARLIAQNVLESFTPSFMVNGKYIHPWHSVDGHGHILPTIYVLGIAGTALALFKLILGMYHAAYAVFTQSLADAVRKIQQTLQSREVQLFGLAIIGLGSSAVTVDAPHTTRSLYFFVIFSLLAILFFQTIVKKIQRRYAVIFCAGVVGITLVLCTQYYLVLIQDYPTQQRELFKFGLRQALIDMPKELESVAAIDQDGYDYILYSWYLKLPPEQYFNTVVRQQPNSIGFRYGERVDRYHFISDKSDREGEQRLFYWDRDKTYWVLAD